MFLYLLNFLVLSSVFGELWENDKNCPLTCKCLLEHLTETAIYRFMQNNTLKEIPEPSNYNEVLYDENLEHDFLEPQIVRSAICIINNNTEAFDLIESLPDDIETLTLIQGYNTGSKTIKFSLLSKFKNLLSLELLGPNLLNQKTNSTLISEIDLALPNLKFINLENIHIKNSKTQLQNVIKEFGSNEQTFEYVQKLDAETHPLTMLQQGTNEEIIPYEKYKEQDNDHNPLFVGFRSLYLLRITRCDLNNVHFSMFDGLTNLEYLILDNNNLRFIPPFAFYGTPNLKTLSLAHNNLLDIQLTDLAGLLELEYLDLSYNNFSQLSELSLPPFPKLKLANFGNNPITVIFPNTFEVMNTTDSLIIGSDDVTIKLLTNSFLGLNLLKALTLNNLNLKLLTRDLFTGMPNLNDLTLTGNVTEIEFDTFLNVRFLTKLILSHCHLRNISMDAFIGLEHLQILDLSNNELVQLPAALFDQLINIKEIYLNNNKLSKLPHDIFSKIPAKMIRLNENPWHCSCEMSDWKPIIINRIKHKVIKPCEFTFDKGTKCQNAGYVYKYIYDNKIAPKCAEPGQYLNWNVFHAMRRLLKCTEFKPKFKKHRKTESSTETIQTQMTTELDNHINTVKYSKHVKKIRKIKKYKKHLEMDNNIAMI